MTAQQASDTPPHPSAAAITRHWVRLTTACNNHCLFCLDGDTPRDLFVPAAELERDIARGRAAGAQRLILSGGEATLHPSFVELVAHGRAVGYQRVQVITNGHRFADRRFFERSVEAGLGEITFSLHGHTAELHDRLTGRRGSFERLVKGLLRGLRTDGLIVNVDIVVSRQNIAVLDRVVERCLLLGVREIDLLNIIPQGRAFANREALLYDPREHLPQLRRVLALACHPGVTLWTNRFPAAYLEGLEDLIQDPRKLCDELRGRRHQLRRYLDTGEPLDCRQVDRCRHCFVEPACTSIDRVVAAQNARRWEIWWVGAPPAQGAAAPALPFGCSHLGVQLDGMADLDALTLPSGAGLYARVGNASALDAVACRPLILVAAEPAQLEAWLVAPLPQGVEIDIELNRRTAPWLLAQAARVDAALDALRLWQPGHLELERCREHDVADQRAFFMALGLPVAVSGLPPCLMPGAVPVAERRVLDRALFDADSGRLDVQPLARRHIAEDYRVKSLRCERCVLDPRCPGASIQLVRRDGFSILEPLTGGAEAERMAAALARVTPQPPTRLATGRSPEPVAASLPGYPAPSPPPPDPLAALAVAAPADGAAAMAGDAGHPAAEE